MVVRDSMTVRTASFIRTHRLLGQNQVIAVVSNDLNSSPDNGTKPEATIFLKEAKS
jgi:hypothetical protein